MSAKQTLSASLVVALVGIAQADPAPDGQGAPGGKTGQFQVGFGYGVDSGLFGGARVSQSNLWGTGDLLALDAQISARRQLVQLHFADPYILDHDIRLDLNVYDDRRVLPGFTRDAIGASTMLSHKLGDRITVFGGYRFEHVMPSADIVPITHELDPTTPVAAMQPYNLAALRAGMAYSSIDTPLFPRRGSTLGASIEVADPRYGSDIQFTRVDAWGSTHQALAGGLTLHLTGKLAAIGSRDADGVPEAERIFLAGSTELPGFLPGSIGPSYGGNLLAVGRAELEVPISRRLGLSLIGFYAAGSVSDWHGRGGIGQSTGIGIMWRSPIGPLRLDYAIPFGGDRSPGFIFGLGASF